MNQVINYLGTLSPEELEAAIKAMPLEEQMMLLRTACHNLNRMAIEIVKNKDEIWETGELPQLFDTTPRTTQ